MFSVVCLCLLLTVLSSFLVIDVLSQTLEDGYHWGRDFYDPFTKTVARDKLFVDEWVPLGFAERLNYFSLYEICLYDTGDNHDVCSKQAPYDSFKLFEDCKVTGRGIGHVNGFCPNVPGLFMRHKSIKPWPEGKHVADIIALMKRHGMNKFAFIGDSVMNQQFGDLICTMERMQVKNMAPFGSLDIILKDPNSNEAYDKSKTAFFHFKMLRMDTFDQVAYFKRENISFLQEFLSQDDNKGPAVIYVNIGLHYHSKKTYNDDLVGFLHYIKHFAKEHGHIVIYRETSAQHFATPDKLFTMGIDQVPPPVIYSAHHLVENRMRATGIIQDQKDIIPPFNINQTITSHLTSALNGEVYFPQYRLCEPFTSMEQVQAHNWKNQMLYEELDKIDPGRKHVHVAEFFNITAGRFDIHMNRFDCTHFCFGPMLWHTLWQQIYDIIYKNVKRGGRRFLRN